VEHAFNVDVSDPYVTTGRTNALYILTLVSLVKVKPVGEPGYFVAS
jgi:hypothetical protein